MAASVACAYIRCAAIAERVRIFTRGGSHRRGAAATIRAQDANGALRERTTMIARIWRGATAAADGETYLAYLEDTGLAEYRSTPGNCGVLALRRTVGDRAEFLLLTLWESEAAVRNFAGDDIGRAVFYPEDDRFLVQRDERVDHFEVVYRADEHGP
jgi:heme-degrading monooxygenase HmoA